MSEMLNNNNKKKMGGGGGAPTLFWREHALKNTQIWKTLGFVSKLGRVSVSLKVLQLDLWSELFSAKYCLSGPIKWVKLTGKVP